MVKFGIVKEFDGNYGYIISKNDERFDFCKEDISFDRPLQVDDPVIFRAEDKGKELKLARNVTKTDGR